MSVLLAPKSLLDEHDADTFERSAYVPGLPGEEATDAIVLWMRQHETFLERRMRESAEDPGPDAHGLGPKAADRDRPPKSEAYDDLCEQEAADRAAGREWE